MNDESLMPFGKYKNKRLIDVPAYYLIWAYENIVDLRPDLKGYIESNLDVLRMEIKSKKGVK